MKLEPLIYEAFERYSILLRQGEVAPKATEGAIGGEADCLLRYATDETLR